MSVATYEKVAIANDKDIKSGVTNEALSYLTMIKKWKNNVIYNEFASTKKKHKAMLKNYQDLAGIVNDSRDPFSSSRSYPWLGWKWIGLDRFGVFKQGGTDFHQVKIKKYRLQWQWTAMDTVSFRHKYYNWRGKKRDKERLQFGGGAAHALNKSRRNSSDKFKYKKYRHTKQNTFFRNGSHQKGDIIKGARSWGHAWYNGSAAKSAYKEDKYNNMNDIGGLRPFYTISHDNKKDVGPGVTAFLSKPSTAVRVSKTLDDTDINYNRTARGAYSR